MRQNGNFFNLYAKLIALCFFVSFAFASDVEQCVELYEEYKYEEALSYCQSSAKSGNAKSQFYLGLMYESGKGLEKDADKARDWYHLAAMQGYWDAQLHLGLFYSSIEKSDAKEAYIWFQIASIGYEKGEKEDPDGLLGRQLFLETSDVTSSLTESEIVSADIAVQQRLDKIANRNNADETAQVAIKNENSNLAEKIDGYKDLKFGMSESEANSTDILNNSPILFGERRDVLFAFDAEREVVLIGLLLGDYDKEVYNKTIDLLSSKYKLNYQPSKNDWDKYEQDRGADGAPDLLGLLEGSKKIRSRASVSRSNYNKFQQIRQLGARHSLVDLTNSGLHTVEWWFANYQVAFSVMKIVDKYEFKDKMIVIYAAEEVAKSTKQILEAKKAAKDKKTTSDDF